MVVPRIDVEQSRDAKRQHHRQMSEATRISRATSQSVSGRERTRSQNVNSPEEGEGKVGLKQGAKNRELPKRHVRNVSSTCDENSGFVRASTICRLFV